VLATTSLFALHWIQVQIPQLIVVIKDEVENGKSLSLILKFIAIAAGVIVCRTVSRWYFFYPARLQQRELRNELLAGLSTTSPSKWQHHPVGKLYQLLVNDLDQIRAFVGFALLQMVNLAIALSIMVPAMNRLNSDLFISLLPLAITFVLFSFSLLFTTKLADQASKHHDLLQQMLIEFFDAKKTLNTFCREESAANEFSMQSNKELDSFFFANMIRSWTRPLLLLGGALSTVYAAWLVEQLHLPLSYLLAYGAFIFMLQEPLGYLSWIGIIATETLVSWKRLKGISKDLAAEQNGSIFTKHTETFLELDLKMNTQSLNTSLLAGSRTLLCGPTGGGKTTLLLNIHQAALSQGYKTVLVVQEPHLFNQTLVENLLLGDSLTEALEEKVLQLLKVFELDNLAKSKDELLNLKVGENGKKLSGGQIKRLHLARSLLYEYDVVLWDDPFSSVDVLTEKRMMENLEKYKYLNNKILLITSHRITTVKFASDIIFCSKHEIIKGQWQHDAVLKQKLELLFGAKVGRYV